MLFVALNGDNVGTKIGQSIANDDHEGLDKTQGSVKQAHAMVDQWVAKHGGKTVSASGDEGIYSLPEEAAQDLEQIKSEYSRISGHSLTVGTGSSMSEASKALIYGKLNGKDQIVQYDDNIEQAISQGDESVEAPEEEVSEEAQSDEEGFESQEALPGEEEVSEESFEEDEEEAEAGLEEVPADIPGESEAVADVGEEEILPQDGAAREGAPIDPEDEGSVSEEIQPEESEELTGTGPDNMPPIDGEVPEEGVEAAPGEGEDGTGELPPQEQKGVEDEESVYDDLTESDVDPIDGEEEVSEGFEEEGQPSNPDDMLTEMISSHMSEEDEEGEEGSEVDNEGLKQEIAAALSAFRAHRETLEATKEQNPELYEATITMLRAMIDMARQQGMSPEEDLETADARQEAEGMPFAGDIEEGEEEEEGEVAPQEAPEEEVSEALPGEEESEGVKKKPLGRE